MPKVTIYIRNDDYEAWQMIDDVPEFIHNALWRQDLEDKIMVRDHVVAEGKTLGKIPEPPIQTYTPAEDTA